MKLGLKAGPKEKNAFSYRNPVIKYVHDCVSIRFEHLGRFTVYGDKVQAFG